MTISFNQIPAGIRVPLFYAEFDNSNANQGGVLQPYKVLLIGNRRTAGTIPALQPELVTSETQAKTYFGAGSLLADMAVKFLQNNKSTPLWCVALDDLVAGVAATGKITFTGTPTAAGIVSIMIGGLRIQVAVSTASTPASLATALAAAIQANTDCVVSAVVNGTNNFEVDLTAKNKGEFGNEIDITVSYFSGEVVPAGLTVAVTAMTGGAGNPDVDTVWPVLGDVQYILMVSPYVDSATFGKIETELTGRFGPLEANDGYCIYGKRASHSALVTLGNTRNSQFTDIGAVSGPNSPWQWASARAGQIAASASIDPARPFQTLKLSGILAPKQTSRFTLLEKDILLNNGISTFMVDAGDNVLIEREITTYKLNSFGSPDLSYLDLPTLLTLSYLRFDYKATITSKYPRHKLANDGTRFAQGQAIVTPNVIKAETIAKFRDWEERGLVEGFDQFKEDLIVERSSTNPNRIDVLMPPDLVNQLMIVGVKIGFLL
jgi:phage tail sheath gpL-like